MRNGDQVRACPRSPTGVLLVHGIGEQKPGDTLEEYGTPLAEVWRDFGDGTEPGAADRVTWSCDRGHIHLSRGEVEVASIGEAHWADEIRSEPSPAEVLLWGALIAPYSVLHLLWRPPRWTTNPLRYLARLALWPVRFFLAPLAVVVVQVGCILLAPLMAIAERLDRSSPAPRAVSGILGDAHEYVTEPLVRLACARRVQEAARHQAQTCDALFVVAHSQGAAVSLDAIEADDWPRTSHFVSIGSGFSRLAMLQLLVGTRRSWVEAAFLTLSCWFASVWLLGSEDLSDSAFGDIAFLLLLAVMVVVPLRIRQVRRRTAGWADRRLDKVGLNWIDIWATHDVVPDGPSRSTNSTSLPVRNELSLVRDHTAYSRNSAEVLIPIIREFDPNRFDTQADQIEELRTARTRRFRNQTIATWVAGILAFLVLATVMPESVWWLSYLLLVPLLIPYELTRRTIALRAARRELTGPGRKVSSLPPPPG